MSVFEPKRRRPSAGTDNPPPLPDCIKPAESTVELLKRVHLGEQAPLNLILERYLPSLKRWARGRLPAGARHLLDTDDLVQETVLSTLRHLPDFEYRHEGALHGYLRSAVRNRIRDEIRRVRHRPLETTAGEELVKEEDSPLTELIGREAVDEYERALERLRSSDRELVLARIELGLSYEQIASAYGKSSPDAARMAVARALVKLAKEMTG